MNFYFWWCLSLGDLQALLAAVQKVVNKWGKPRQAGGLLLPDDLTQYRQCWHISEAQSLYFHNFICRGHKSYNAISAIQFKV